MQCKHCIGPSNWKTSKLLEHLFGYISSLGGGFVEEPYLSVVIPAYNEAERIIASLEQVTAYLRNQPYTCEVLVVNDGSDDDTAERVSIFRNTIPVRLLSVAHGGKGWATRHGMLEAKGEYRFLCDADLSMPIEQMGRFLPTELGDYDIAIASRETTNAQRFGEPGYRHLMGRGFNFLVRLLVLRGFYDTQCGFKCFRGSIAEKLFRHQRLDGFGFDVEILFLAQRAQYHIVEVPIDWYFHEGSKVRPIWDTIGMVRDILELRWGAIRGRY